METYTDALLKTQSVVVCLPADETETSKLNARSFEFKTSGARAELSTKPLGFLDVRIKEESAKVKWRSAPDAEGIILRKCCSHEEIRAVEDSKYNDQLLDCPRLNE